jgi:hypothetical protein
LLVPFGNYARLVFGPFRGWSQIGSRLRRRFDPPGVWGLCSWGE